MRIPVLKGTIKRRFLINYRVEPETMQRLLPTPFRPKLQQDFAIAGICLIRLEQIRPAGLPAALGRTSENAAHRVAVEWTAAAGETREGVFIPRRDTDSRLNSWAGGRIFPENSTTRASLSSRTIIGSTLRWIPMIGRFHFGSQAHRMSPFRARPASHRLKKHRSFSRAAVSATPPRGTVRDSTG